MIKPLFEEFKKIGLSIGDNERNVRKIFDLVPKGIKQSRVLRDLLGSGMLYAFGKPLEISGRDVHCFGGNQNIEVKYLYLALRAAAKHLTVEEIRKFTLKISDIEKHQNYLFEMRPILDLRDGLKVHYESQTNCQGNHDVDWEIEYEEYTILLEVKNRTIDMIHHLEYISEILKKLDNGVAPESISSSVAPNPADLFRSVLDKFQERTSKIIQGVWVNSGITEDGKMLNDYFDGLDSKKIQFAIFSGWDDNAYILVKDESFRSILLDCFSLIESDAFISRE